MTLSRRPGRPLQHHPCAFHRARDGMERKSWEALRGEDPIGTRPFARVAWSVEPLIRAHNPKVAGSNPAPSTTTTTTTTTRRTQASLGFFCVCGLLRRSRYVGLAWAVNAVWLTGIWRIACNHRRNRSRFAIWRQMFFVDGRFRRTG